MNQLQVILLVSLNILVALAQWDNGGNDDSSFGPGPSSFGPGQNNFGPGQQQFPPFWGGPQFPGSNQGFGSPFGGPGGPPFGGGRFPQQPFQPFQPPQVLTCIGVNEALDHVKITLRPEPNSNFMSQNPAFQFGSPRELQRRDWRISAVYIPAGSLGAISPSGTSSLVGQFFLAITRYGRTDGSCAGLGGILQNDDLLNNGQQPRSQQQYNQFNNGMFGQSSYPAGFIQDPIVISQGGNVYSGVVRDLSEIDLRGRGVAICLDYLCQRPTTTCCSIVKDTAPATESVGPPSYVGPVSGTSIKGYTGGTGTAVATATAGAGTNTQGSLFGGTSGGLF